MRQLRLTKFERANEKLFRGGGVEKTKKTMYSRPYLRREKTLFSRPFVGVGGGRGIGSDWDK